MGVTQNTASFSQWSNKSLRWYHLSPPISITSSAPPFSFHLIFLVPSFIVLHLPIFHALPHHSASFHACPFFPPSSLTGCSTYLPWSSPRSLFTCIHLFTPDIANPAWKHCVCLYECIPASVQLCVCAWKKTVKTSLRDTLQQHCPLSSHTGIWKQLHTGVPVCMWLCSSVCSHTCLQCYLWPLCPLHRSVWWLPDPPAHPSHLKDDTHTDKYNVALRVF